MSGVRTRLTELAERHGFSHDRRDWLVQTAAGNVGLTLDFLDFALADVEQAEAACLEAHDSKQEWQRRQPKGGGPLGEEGMALFETSRRAYFLFIYRVHTFYVFARILLDAIAALIDKAFAPEQGSGARTWMWSRRVTFQSNVLAR